MYFMEGGWSKGFFWCRRDSILGSHRQTSCTLVAPAPMAVRRSRRLARSMTRLGDFEDPKEMEGEEESAETKTEDEYSPGEFRKPQFFHQI